MKTTAAVLYGTNDLRIEDVEIPELKSGQVLIKMAYSGVCHSQLLEVLGHRGEDPYLPHTLGHEGSGIILEVGPNVKKVKVGDRVILTWIKGRGAEVPSTSYAAGASKINSGAISTFMETTITSENRVIPIPNKMPLREAALLGCMIPTGAGIVFNTAKVRPGQSVVVLGAGGIGLSVILAAKRAGAKPILAVDIHAPKLEIAKQAGATHALLATEGELLARIQALVGAQGSDFAVEAAGKKETMELAFQCIRPAGGVCVLAGNLPSGVKIEINPFDLICGKRLIGTWGGETDPDRDIPKYAQDFLAGKLNLASLITREYELSALSDAFEDLRAGRLGRGVVRFHTEEKASS